MEVECKKSLWWNQEPGYSGSLSEEPDKNPQHTSKVFIEGSRYEVLPLPEQDTNTLEYINVLVVGEDGRGYSITHDSVHYGRTRFALECFDFRPLRLAFEKKDRLTTVKSNVGNGEHDFDGLDGLDLSPDILESIKQARIEARGIIERLDPVHIDNWPDLIGKLKDCLKNAERAEKIMKPRFPELDTREKVADLRNRLIEATKESFEQLNRAKGGS